MFESKLFFYIEKAMEITYWSSLISNTSLRLTCLHGLVVKNPHFEQVTHPDFKQLSLS